jgi:hypothetical protein
VFAQQANFIVITLYSQKNTVNANRIN